MLDMREQVWSADRINAPSLHYRLHSIARTSTSQVLKGLFRESNSLISHFSTISLAYRHHSEIFPSEFQIRLRAGLAHQQGQDSKPLCRCGLDQTVAHNLRLTGGVLALVVYAAERKERVTIGHEG